ncbi:riboflavin synthase domain-like protein [Thozetella sp. PMI_491]|nr:riboflavin synthase domain-like protein [Thozetella sp. PMI_491]
MAYSTYANAGFKLAQLPAPANTADVIAIAAMGAASAAYLLRGIAWDKPNPYHHLWFERPQLKDGATSGRATTTRNIAERLAQLEQDIVIFWGSQSGTAEGFANRLARECHLRFGLSALSADICDYDMDTIALLPNSKRAIFLLSTYGEGDPSDNMAGFWDWLHKAGKDVRLPNLRYMAFGLGNSNYKHYNRVVDVVVETLERAGAKQEMPVGKADDAGGGTEEAFLAWKDDLLVFFQEKLGLQETHALYSPSFAVVEDTSLTPIDLHHGEPLESRSGNAKIRNAYSPIKAVRVAAARELCGSSESSCLHMELDLADQPELRYKTGDHLAIYPMNPEEEVQLLLRATEMDNRVDVPLLINPLHGTAPLNLPTPTTALALFRHYLEVCAPVSRDTMRELAQFAPSQKAKDMLTSLGKDRAAYATLMGITHVTFGRLLALAAPGMTWKDLPLSYLLETIPPIQPRYYSISSSSAVSARRVALTITMQTAVLADDSSKAIRGLTSHYALALAAAFNGTGGASNKSLQGLSYALAGPSESLEGHKLFACIRRSKFKLPALAQTPLVMVAAGSGIAPFRGFILERARLKAIGTPVGRMLLFFGCRWYDKDYLYRDELAQPVVDMDGALEVVTAFSREDSVRRVYVQDRVLERGKEVCELLGEGANIYICGRASMAREVGKAVEEALRNQNQWGETQVQEWVQSTKRGSKWQEDVWG